MLFNNNLNRLNIKQALILTVILTFYIAITIYIFSLYKNVNYILCLFALLFFIVLLVFSIFDFEISLLIFIFITPLIESSRIILGFIDFHFNYILFLAIFAGYIIFVYRNKIILSLNQRIYKPVLLLIFLSFISFLNVLFRNIIIPRFVYGIERFAINILNFSNIRSIYFSGSYFLLFSTGFLIFIIFSKINISSKFLKYFSYTHAFSFLIITGVSFYQIKFNLNFGNFLNYAKGLRINSTFNDPNSFSNYLCLILPIFIGFIFYYWDMEKSLFFIYFILTTLAIFLLPYTGTRAGLIGLSMIIIYYLIFGWNILTRKIIKKFKNKMFLIKTISWLLFFLFIFMIFFGIYILVFEVGFSDKFPIGIRRVAKNIENFFKGNFKDIFYSRDKLWKQAIRMFADKPISGIGIGQYIFKLPDYNLKYYDNPKIVLDNTLNLYLEILAEMGIFAIIFFIWFVIELILCFMNIYKFRIDYKLNFLLKNMFIGFVLLSIIYSFSGATSSFAVRYLFFILAGLIVNLSNNIVNKNLLLYYKVK